jgi:hypothetical protein
LRLRNFGPHHEYTFAQESCSEDRYNSGCGSIRKPRVRTSPTIPTIVMAVGAALVQLFPDDVRAEPKAAREFLAHHRDTGAGTCVTALDPASSQHRNSQGTEVIRADQMIVRDDTLEGARWLGDANQFGIPSARGTHGRPG